MATITQKNNTEPSTPTNGSTVIYVDSTTKKLTTKDDAGTVTNYGTDELVKVSANDTAAGYLESKIVAGTNVTVETLNDGANETFRINATSGSSLDPETTIDVLDFMLNDGSIADSGPFNFRNLFNGIGSGVVARINTDSRQAGGYTFNCGTGAVNNRAGIYTGAIYKQYFFDGNCKQTFTTYTSINDLGTLGTDERQDSWGWGDNYLFSEHSNGVYFYRFNPEASGNIQFVAALGGVRTKIDTGFAPTVNVPFKIHIEVESIASVLTATAWINDVMVPTPITTNIPNSAANGCGITCRVLRKNATATPFTIDMLGYIRYTMTSSGRF